MSSFFQNLRFWLHRRRNEEDLRYELQFYLEEEAEERQAAGLHSFRDREFPASMRDAR